MKVTVTAKVRLFPSVGQEETLRETNEAFVAACNFVSDFAYANQIEDKSRLHKNCYYPIRDKFALRSQMAESVCRRVSGSYKTILKNQKKWIKAVYKHSGFVVVAKRSYSIRETNGRWEASICTLGGRKRMPMTTKGNERFFDGTWKLGDANIITKHGKWYLCISCSKKFPDTDLDEVENVVGVDLGLNFLAVSYDSNGRAVFYPGREAKQRRNHYKELRSDLQAKGTKSAKRRLKRIGNKEHRWMNDVNHCIAKALVTNASSGSLFVLEDLKGIRYVTEKVKRKDRYTQVSWAFFDLKEKLVYKAHMSGCEVIFVNPEYTSQRCPKCGHIEASNRNKKKHTFKCKECGYTSNDDRIGAMNLFWKGNEYLKTVTTKQDLSVEGAVNHPAMQSQDEPYEGCMGSESNEGFLVDENALPSGDGKPSTSVLGS